MLMKLLYEEKRYEDVVNVFDTYISKKITLGEYKTELLQSHLNILTKSLLILVNIKKIDIDCISYSTSY